MFKCYEGDLIIKRDVKYDIYSDDNLLVTVLVNNKTIESHCSNLELAEIVMIPIFKELLASGFTVFTNSYLSFKTINQVKELIGVYGAFKAPVVFDNFFFKQFLRQYKDENLLALRGTNNILIIDRSTGMAWCLHHDEWDKLIIE